MHDPITIWKMFKIIFPNESKSIKQFKSHNGNSITLWFSDRPPIIFTMYSDKNWKLEPYHL